MNARSQNLVVGAFVVASVMLLLFGVFFLKETSPSSKYDNYFVIFDQVSTLQVGDPVKVNGVKMGKINSIELQGTLVKVAIQVSQGIGLTTNSEIRIQNIGLMGERQMGIHLGNAKEIMPPGGTFMGKLDAGIAEAMGVVGEVFIEVDALVKTMRRTMDSSLGHPEFAGRINKLLVATEEMTYRLSALTKDVDPKIRQGAKSFQELGKEANRFTLAQEPQVEEIIKLSTEAAHRARNLSERGESVAQKLEEMLAKMNSPKGSLGALMQDTTLHHDLLMALESADSLFRNIKKEGLDVNIDFF